MLRPARFIAFLPLVCGIGLGGFSQPQGHARVLRLLWATATPWPWLRTPAVMDSTLYLMTEHSSLSAVDLRTGQLITKISPPQRGDYETPSISAGMLYVSCGSDNVSAFRLPDLSLEWSTSLAAPAA